MDLEILLASQPVNKLAAIVTGSSSVVEDETPPFEDIHPNALKNRVWVLKKQTGERYGSCLDAVAQKAGYKNFIHYTKVLQSRGDYLNSAEATAKKKAKASAKWQAEMAESGQ